MIPELGHFALILALCMALVLAVVPIAGAMRSVAGWVVVARPAAYGQLLFVLVAYACLTHSFLVHDFSVYYVAMNSNTALPTLYLFSGVWGAHEGSLLLWALVLSCWTALVARFSRGIPDVTIARVLGVMGMVAIGFILFLLLTSNPFVRVFPAPAEGRDLNPLLQDVGLAIHPPMLYMGYVGFSVAFAFAIAALMQGRLDAAWARWSRPWTTVAWTFLDAGHCARQLVGLLRTGLGRLVVLGSGRERFVHALAGRHGFDPLLGGYRKTRRVQDLDGVACYLCLFLKFVGYFPSALGRVDFRPRLRQRPGTRLVYT